MAFSYQNYVTAQHFSLQKVKQSCRRFILKPTKGNRSCNPPPSNPPPPPGLHPPYTFSVPDDSKKVAFRPGFSGGDNVMLIKSFGEKKKKKKRKKGEKKT